MAEGLRVGRQPGSEFSVIVFVTIRRDGSKTLVDIY